MKAQAKTTRRQSRRKHIRVMNAPFPDCIFPMQSTNLSM